MGGVKAIFQQLIKWEKTRTWAQKIQSCLGLNIICEFGQNSSFFQISIYLCLSEEIDYYIDHDSFRSKCQKFKSKCIKKIRQLSVHLTEKSRVTARSRSGQIQGLELCCPAVFLLTAPSLLHRVDFSVCLFLALDFSLLIQQLLKKEFFLS